jgi:hypothetical protein
MSDTIFVSMPFGDVPDSAHNEWTKLFEHGLKPLEHEMSGLPEGIHHVPVKLWRADRRRWSGSDPLAAVAVIHSALRA